MSCGVSFGFEVRLQVLGRHQPVPVHPLTLVDEERRELGRLGKEGRVGHEDALEDVCEVANGELVVKVVRRLAEGARNFVVQLQRRLDDLVLESDVGDLRIEFLDVPIEEGREDGH